MKSTSPRSAASSLASWILTFLGSGEPEAGSGHNCLDSPSEESSKKGELGQEDQADKEKEGEVSPCTKLHFVQDFPEPKAVCGCPIHELPQDLPATLLL